MLVPVPVRVPIFGMISRTVATPSVV